MTSGQTSTRIIEQSHSPSGTALCVICEERPAQEGLVTCGPCQESADAAAQSKASQRKRRKPTRLRAKRKGNSARSSAKLREKRKREGRCVGCGRQLDPRSQYLNCAACLAYARDYRRDNREVMHAKAKVARRRRNMEKRAKGECKNCNQPVRPGSSLCQTHWEAMKKKLAAASVKQKGTNIKIPMQDQYVGLLTAITHDVGMPRSHYVRAAVKWVLTGKVRLPKSEGNWSGRSHSGTMTTKVSCTIPAAQADELHTIAGEAGYSMAYYMRTVLEQDLEKRKKLLAE